MRECPDAWPPRSGQTLTPTGLLWLAREPMPRSATEATDRRSTTNAKTRTKRHTQRSQEKSGGTIRRRRDTLAECCRRKKPQQAATDVRITPELSRAAKRRRLGRIVSPHPGSIGREWCRRPRKSSNLARSAPFATSPCPSSSFCHWPETYSRRRPRQFHRPFRSGH